MASQYIPLQPGAAPTLGYSGDAVKAYQTQLNTQNAGKAGYTPLVVDGKYGSLTQAASQYKNPTPAPITKTAEVVPTQTTSSTSRKILYNDPNEPSVIAARSEEDIQKDKLAGAQGILSSLNSYYDKLVDETKVIGEGRMRKTNAISALTGLSGSTEANFQSDKTEGVTNKEIDSVNKERQLKINEILYNIKSSSAEEARAQRLEARQSESDRIAYREKTQAKAVENLTMLSKSSSGASLEGLRSTLGDEEYDKLISNAGGEAMAAAILFENRPKDTVVGSPTLVGGKMVQAYQTPDGKIKYENVDLPAGVTPDQIQSIEKTDSGIFIINKNGTYKRITGSGKTYAPGTGTGTGGGGSTTGTGDIAQFPKAIQDAAQAIYSGKSKLTEYPSKDRLAINSAAQILYSQEGGNELAQGAYSAIETLESHPGFTGAIGAKGFSSLFGLKGKPMEGSPAASYLAALDTVKANIKLINIKYLKGTGALSDAEGKTLEDAGTTLSTALSETDFKKELARIKAVLLKANNIDTGQSSNMSADGKALQTNGAQISFSVTTPDGQTFSFPTQAALDQFKKAAHL